MDAMKRKIEHIPNMTMMGNALTFKDGKKHKLVIPNIDTSIFPTLSLDLVSKGE